MEATFLTDMGRRIKERRNDLRLSQEELAEKAGLHHTYIGQLERGEKNATLESIGKVARALDLPFEVLFEAIIYGDTDNAIAKEVYELITARSKKEQLALSDLIKRVVEYKQI